jgi:hypothetical protein
MNSGKVKTEIGFIQPEYLIDISQFHGLPAPAGNLIKSGTFPLFEGVQEEVSSPEFYPYLNHSLLSWQNQLK